MTKASIDAFISEMSNYNFYKNKLNSLKEQIEDCWYEMTGVKAVRYDRQVTMSYNPELSSKKRDMLSKKIDKLEKEKLRINMQLNYLDKILKQCRKKQRQAIIDIYANGLRYEDVAKKLNMSIGSIQYQIKADLKRIRDN